MKQRIQSVITTPSSGYQIKIISVHEVDNQLIAVSKVKHPNGLVLTAIGSAKDVVIVKTSSNQELPVKHYLTGVPKEEQDHHIGMYARGESWGNREATEFTPIADVSEIAELLSRGKCIYQPRTDGMIAKRVSRFVPNQTRTAATQPVEFSQDDMRAFVNIHMINDDDTIKVVFETLHQVQQRNDYNQLYYLIDAAMRAVPSVYRRLEQAFHQTSDDIFRFDAVNHGETSKYETAAVEFSVPANNPNEILNLFRFIEALAAAAKATMQHQQPYQHVQISNHSVTAEFDELITTSKQSRHDENDAYIIKAPAAVDINQFMNRTGTVHEPKNIAEELLTQFCQMQNVPEYSEAQFLLQNRNKLDGLDLTDTAKCEAALANPETRALASLFLPSVHEQNLKKLYQPALGKPSHDGGKYDERYTEFALMDTSHFILRADGRISIQPDGEGYQEFYAPGTRNHDILEAEFKFLANVLGLEFAEGCDFHKEMIFTEASSLKLKAMGLHLNLDNYPAPQQPEPVNVTSAEQPVVVRDNPINSRTAAEIIKQHPYVSEILAIMHARHIFTGNADSDSRLFADLINACDEIEHPAKFDNYGRERRPRKNTIESLLKLYRLADEHNITSEIHRAIINDIARFDQLDEVAELFNAVPNMDADKAKKLFLAANSFIQINGMTQMFDDSNDSFLHLLNTVNDYRRLSSFEESLSMSMMFGERGIWMTKDLYKIIVDHINTDSWYKIKSGFADLYKAGVLEEYKDQYLQNLDLYQSLHEMHMNDMLNKTNIPLLFANHDFADALQACNTFNLIGWRAKNYSGERDKAIKNTILANPELAHALKVLLSIANEKGERLTQNEFDAFNNDAEDLLAAAGVLKAEGKNAVASLVKQGIAFFSQQKPKTVAEVLEKVKEKYHYQEPVVVKLAV